jgi:hypothetical protein
MTYIIPSTRFPFAHNTSFDFSGGDLTSDGGLLMLGELSQALGINEELIVNLVYHPLRRFDDAELVVQKAMLIAAGYHADDDATGLREDPAFAQLFGHLASQETISRRFSAMTKDDVERLRRALDKIYDKVAGLNERTECVIDIDTTLLCAFGRQDGSAWNYHYAKTGFHPIIATDTLTRDVLGFELRSGTQYCSKDAGAFTEGVLERSGTRHPKAHLFVRGDAGFASPEVYEACERDGAGYVIRLKANAVLYSHTKSLATLLAPGQAAIVYKEFSYQAASWTRPRRVVAKCEMAEGELVPRHTFIVTNMSLPPHALVDFYCHRGSMELIIGELKEGFLTNCVQSKNSSANEFRCLVGILAYGLMNWLRRLALPGAFVKEKTTTLRARFIKVAAKKVAHARSTLFRFPTSYPCKNAFYRMLENMWRLSSA